MNGILLEDLPDEYKLMMNKINDSTIKRIYTNFNFLYFNLSPDKINDKDINMNIFEVFLLEYLNKFKFITYHISNSYPRSQYPIKEDKTDFQTKLNANKVNVIICIEKECIIIEQINASLFSQIMNQLKSNKFPEIISNCENETSFKENEIIANTDILCSILNDNKSNNFISYTFWPIAAYIIGRYFYPKDYFNDPSFFIFQRSSSNEKEQNIKRKITHILYKTAGNYISDMKLNEIINDIKSEKYKRKEVNYTLFDESEFIELELIYSNKQAIYKLVIHRKSLYIFLMKKIESSDKNSKENNREINFCKCFSNRYLTHFYGFVKKNEAITAFIYEYMSNKSLNSYISDKPKYNNEIFNLISLIRIFQGIEYIHSQSLIHRDISSTNILLDNDYLPYISDFPTIRHIIDENDIGIQEYTNDIGCNLYCSPEQYRGSFISYPTDIYSYGLIIYFLNEQKHLKANAGNKPFLNNVSDNLQHLFQSCIEFDPNKRLTIDEIREIINIEIHSFLAKDHDYSNISYNTQNIIVHLIYELVLFKQIDIKVIKQFIYNTKLKSNNRKNIRSISSLADEIKNKIQEESLFYPEINKFLFFYTLAEYIKDPNGQYEYAMILFEDKLVNCDIYNSIHYLKLASSQNHSKATYMLGFIYYNDIFVERNIEKSVEYLTKAADLNNSDAQSLLGLIYMRGIYVQSDIDKSIKYLTLAANQNDVSAQIMLGILYYYYINFSPYYFNKSIYYLSNASNQNYVVAQIALGSIYYDLNDFDRSIYYFTLAANQNDSESQYRLGEIFYYGQGVPKDINKSIHYYTLSANQNHSKAQYMLAFLLYFGQGAPKDIDKSLYYLTLSANQNDSDSQYILGSLLYDDNNVTQDINKSIYYLKLAAKQNNQSAMYKLYTIYNEGKYVPKNTEKSLYYLQSSAKLNFATAQNQLGILYYQGIFFKQDINKSIYYFELAAQKNDPNAQRNLGIIYLTHNNIIEGLKYLHYSATNNDRESQSILGDLYFEGKYVKQDIQKSISFYKSTASFYDQRAKNNLGIIFKNGLGNTQKNLYLAKEYLHEAINDKNDLLSMYNLANILLDELEFGSNPSKNEKEPINLLIRSFECGFIESKILLCILLLKKYSFIDLKTLEKEFLKIGIESFKNIEEIFKSCIMIKCRSLEEEYSYFRHIDLVYIYDGYIVLDEINQLNNQNKLNENKKAKKLTASFYEGFGKDLY